MKQDIILEFKYEDVKSKIETENDNGVSKLFEYILKNSSSIDDDGYNFMFNARYIDVGSKEEYVVEKFKEILDKNEINYRIRRYYEDETLDSEEEKKY